MSAKKKRTLGYCPEGGWGKDVAPFNKLFTHKICIDQEGALDQIDCLLMFGGSDIHPSYYRQKTGKFTGGGANPSRRDDFEWRAMLFCKVHDIPMIGLCRGGQFLTVFAGGSLIQHVQGHNGTDHQIETHDGKELWTNSVHHQMMNPDGTVHQLLAWASPRRSKVYLDGDDQDIPWMQERHEPEIIYYPGIRGLAIQGHPEYSSAPRAFQDLCVELAAEHLFNEKFQIA
jgi:GMP synthase-like glutamine amidotransferase